MGARKSSSSSRASCAPVRGSRSGGISSERNMAGRDLGRAWLFPGSICHMANCIHLLRLTRSGSSWLGECSLGKSCAHNKSAVETSCTSSCDIGVLARQLCAGMWCDHLSEMAEQPAFARLAISRAQAGTPDQIQARTRGDQELEQITP